MKAFVGTWEATAEGRQLEHEGPPSPSQRKKGQTSINHPSWNSKVPNRMAFIPKEGIFWQFLLDTLEVQARQCSDFLEPNFVGGVLVNSDPAPVAPRCGNTAGASLYNG